MEELLKAMAPMGVGGILAAFIFWFYRQDRLSCKGREEMLVDALRDAAVQQKAVAANIEELVKSVHAMMAQGQHDMRFLIQALLKQSHSTDELAPSPRRQHSDMHREISS